MRCVVRCDFGAVRCGRSAGRKIGGLDATVLKVVAARGMDAPVGKTKSAGSIGSAKLTGVLTLEATSGVVKNTVRQKAYHVFLRLPWANCMLEKAPT